MATTREVKLHRALQISSGWLVLLANKFGVDEAETRATIRHQGEVLADLSLAEALDMANTALEPEPSEADAITDLLGKAAAKSGVTASNINRD